MHDPHRPADPRLITIPSSDSAFREHVTGLRPRPGQTPAELEERLRRMFPRVVVRERSLASEAPAWYVYRDGAWRSSLEGNWWDDPSLPRIVLSAEGWLIEISPTAAGILGIDPADVGSRHFTDFVVPGTLDDALALFRVIEQGRDLNATILVRPESGDIIAVDLHSTRRGTEIVNVLRLAADVDVAAEVPMVDRPAAVSTIPATDVAFRSYVLQAVERMPEPTPDGLALRLRRLYPHAAVRADDRGWVAQRDGPHEPSTTDAWWEQPGLPCVRYDAQGLILEANDAADAFLGHKLAGHYWQEFVTPGSTDQVSLMLEILARVGAAESRFRMPRADGRLVEFDSYSVVQGEEYTTVIRALDRAP